MDEALVILAKGSPVAALEVMAVVRQRYGDRVFVVAAADIAPLRRLGAVFAANETASHAGDDLTQTERMGIDAWNARPALATKQRPGEGLAWDAKGFEPP